MSSFKHDKMVHCAAQCVLSACPGSIVSSIVCFWPQIASGGDDQFHGLAVACQEECTISAALSMSEPSMTTMH